MKTIQGFVSGRVQGVGFRYFIQQQAHTVDVYGYAKNLPDGRVEFVLQGDDESVQHVLDMVYHGPAMSIVDSVEVNNFDAANKLVSFDVS